MLFRRNGKHEEAATPVEHEKVGGKGRPTPTRREAEAAARERARAGMDKKQAKSQLRERRAAANRKMREGIKAGDERYLPARDQGPVKRFVRDYVDARLSFTELLLPLLVIIMVLMYSGNESVAEFASSVWTVSILLMVIDCSWLVFRVKRAVRAQLPDESLKGVTSYAILRALQLRFMRLPKPKVKLGGRPV